MKLELFTKPACPACVTFKAQIGPELLRNVTQRDVSQDKEAYDFLINKQVRTVPACFVNDTQVTSLEFRQIIEANAATASD